MQEARTATKSRGTRATPRDSPRRIKEDSRVSSLDATPREEGGSISRGGRQEIFNRRGENERARGGGQSGGSFDIYRWRDFRADDR